MTNIKRAYILIKNFIEEENTGWKIEWINTRAFKIFKDEKEITFGYGKNYSYNLKHYYLEDYDDAFSLQKSVYEDMYDYAEVIDPSERDVEFISDYKPDGYLMVTDDKKALDTEWVEEEVDTKAYYIHNEILNEFWECGGFELMSEEINLVANNVACYTYKGKYFYIVPKFDEVYFEYCFFNKYDEIEWESIETIGIYKVPKEEVDRIVNIILDWKKDLEIKSIPYFLYEEYEDKCKYKTIEYLEIDKYDIVDLFSEFIIPDVEDINSIKKVFEDFLFTRNGDEFTNAANNRKIKIPNFEKMVKRFGFEIKKTGLPGADVKTTAFIKYDEEYHISWLEFLTDVFDEVFEECDEKDVEFEKIVRRKTLEKLKEIHSYLYKRYLNKIEISNILKEAKNVCVTLEDSLKGGNCKSGTMNFIKNHNIDKEKVKCINGKELFDIADESEKRYVLNAIKAAIVREKGELW